MESLPSLGSEVVSFTLAAVLYIVSEEAGLLEGDKSPSEKFSLFMRFASAVDPKLDPARTLRNYSGKFLNYAMSKITSDTSCVSTEALKRLSTALETSLASKSARNVVIGMLGVRDASYFYVHLHSDPSLRKLVKEARDVFCGRSGRGR